MNWFKRLTGGLDKTATGIKDSIGSIFTGKKLDLSQLQDLEDQLIQSDIGIDVSEKLVKKIKSLKLSSETNSEDILKNLSDVISEILIPVAKPLLINSIHKPYVIVLAGVNGSGKTTTAGKLASQFKEEGKSVMLVACDTFRAAASEQLQVWGDRAGVKVLTTEAGGDAAALAYRSLSEAQENNTDVLIIDTAGRLQVKQELMQELEKIVRVLGKRADGCPHDRIIVLDGGTGQNAHSQVEEFCKVIDISGLIITKLDGSAKGGVVIALAEKFGLPIYAVGVGEGINDLNSFDAKDFSKALLGIDKI